MKILKMHICPCLDNIQLLRVTQGVKSRLQRRNFAFVLLYRFLNSSCILYSTYLTSNYTCLGNRRLEKYRNLQCPLPIHVHGCP